MIKVKVIYIDDEMKSIEVSGHAYDAPSGESIVCAGVSTLVLGNLSYAEKMNYGQINVFQRKDGYIQAVIQEHSESLDILLNAIILSVKELASDYPKHLRYVEIIENKK